MEKVDCEIALKLALKLELFNLRLHSPLQQVKRTSLWNKACEELRKHQELLVKCQQDENFLRDRYNDPFPNGDSRITQIMNDESLTLSPSAGPEQDGSLPLDAEAVAEARKEKLVAAAAASLQSGGKKRNKSKKAKKVIPSDVKVSKFFTLICDLFL